MKMRLRLLELGLWLWGVLVSLVFLFWLVVLAALTCRVDLLLIVMSCFDRYDVA